MKEISMKRILRLYLAAFIVLFLAAWSNPANAETGNQSGNLTIDAGAGNTYINEGAAVGGGTAFDWTGMFFDSTDYNRLSRIDITFESNWAFAFDGGSTSVCITSGGSGCGTVSMSKIDRKVSFYFTEAVITSSTVVLDYGNKDFLDGITIAASIQQSAAFVPSLTEPVRFKSNTGGALPTKCNTNVNFGCTFFVSSSTQAVNHYYANYSGNLVNVTISKTGATINTQVNISNDTALKFVEGAFDTTGYSYTFIYDTGLALNMSDASGNYDYVILNTTNSTFPAALPTPTINPYTGVGIMFDSASYVIGATANISWIRSSSTPFGYQDDIYLIQPSTTGTVKKILVSSPPNSGYVKTNDLPVPGAYNVSFERSLFGFGFSPEILATDSADVSAEMASYIIVNDTVPVGVYTNGTYLYGWNGTGRIVVYQDLADGTVKEIDSLAINTICCVEHTVQQLFFPEPGNYRVVLMKGYSEVKAVASVVAYLSDIVPGANITVSNISVDKSQYTYGEPYTITYQVDSFNYSTKAKRIIAYEVATGANTLVNIVPAQTGSITRTFDSEMFPFSGALEFRLMGLNASGDYMLANVSFTLSKIDTEGYGLSVTKSPICIKETGYFTYYSPSAVSVSISDRYATVYSKNLTSAVSGKTVPFTINRAGNYEIFLRPSNETDVKFTKIIEVKACDVAAQTQVSGAGQAQQVAAMITTPVFWALLVTAGLMIAIAWKTRDGFAAGSVGMLSAGVFAFMSWLPLWIFFSALIIAALLLSSSLVAKQLKKTG